MKKLNYYLCAICLFFTFVFTAVWLKTSNSDWMLLSGTLFLSSIIFFFASEAESSKEELIEYRAMFVKELEKNAVKQQRNFFNEVTKKECEIEKIDSVS